MNTKEKRKTHSIVKRLLRLIKKVNEPLYHDSEAVEMAEDYLDELNLGEESRSRYAEKYKRHKSVR